MKVQITNIKEYTEALDRMEFLSSVSYLSDRESDELDSLNDELLRFEKQQLDLDEDKDIEEAD